MARVPLTASRCPVADRCVGRPKGLKGKPNQSPTLSSLCLGSWLHSRRQTAKEPCVTWSKGPRQAPTNCQDRYETYRTDLVGCAAWTGQAANRKLENRVGRTG
jgi:hypothetical protein